MGESLTPPADLRPAQVGIVLVGRVVLGHIGATLVDLAQRGFLRIEEIPDDDEDWLLTDLRGPAATRTGLLPFEATLLDGLFIEQPAVRLGQISQDLVCDGFSDGRRVGDGQPEDFARAWSAPREHSHGSHGHSTAHGGYGGGYHDSGGGHGGGMGAGGHGGH